MTDLDAAARRVVVIGDALIDEVRDERGVREFVGGAALNVAVGLSRLGLPATLIAMVGDDVAGAHIRAYLEDYRVELIATPGPHGSSRAVSVRTAGEPTYEFNRAAKERRIAFGESERRAVATAAYVVVSCVPFDDEEQTAELAGALAARRGGLAIDPNPRTGMMRDLDAFVRGFESVVAGADLVKIGDDDATLLYGEKLAATRDRLRALGARAVFATAGAAGAEVAAEGVAASRPIAELPGRIVDTMGGGDASIATVVHGLVGGWPADEDAWDALLARAMDVAGATCRAEGALLRLPAPAGADDHAGLGS